MKLLYLFFESMLTAFRSLWVNKLRTFLSLLGVVIGIFVIILILASVDSLKRDINKSINSLGSSLVFVHKWPWEGGFDYPWWKFVMRPQPKLEEAEQLTENLYTAKAVTFSVKDDKTAKYRGNAISDADVSGVWLNYASVHNLSLQAGRYLTPREVRAGIPVAVIGNQIKEKLYPQTNALGKSIKIDNLKFTVIGILETEGGGLFNFGLDNKIIISYANMRKMVNLSRWWVMREIAIQAKPQFTNSALKNEIIGQMRAMRKLRPNEPNNFALNEPSAIAEQTGQITVVLNIVGWIIGLLAIFVGGFGIANIMFVSVKERTNIIGIQKALGAKRWFILFQFLTESLFLSLLGGIIGLFMVAGISIITQMFFNFNMILSFSNIFTGIIIASVIGLVSGIIPAWSAARLDPVTAIRSK